MWSNVFRMVLGVWIALTASSAIGQKTNLLEWSSPWWYSQDGRLPATNWNDTSYSDGNWRLAPGVFGVPLTEPLPSGLSVTTPLLLATNGSNILTYYFRTRINLWRTNDLVLTASNVIDDGAVVYLNGHEVQRLGMNPGAVDYTTSASRGGEVVDPGRGVETYAITITNAVVGENLLAVELHQVGTNSVDAVFGMKVVADYLQAPIIVRQPQDLTLQEGRTGGFTNEAIGTSPLTYRWYTNTPPATNFVFYGVTLPSLTINATPAMNGRRYMCVVSNAVGVITSRVATLTVITDRFGPRLLEAMRKGLNYVDLTWDETVAAIQATNLLNYTLHVLGTTNTVSITNIQYGFARVRLWLADNLNENANYAVCARNIADTRTNTTDNECIGVTFITPVPAFSFGTDWKFFVPLFGGSVATNWTQPEYQPDDTWGDGFARFAFDSTPAFVSCSPEVQTVLPIGANAYYFRKTFFMPSALPPPVIATFTAVVDDGAVFYLNGVELLRLRMPAAPAAITSDTIATSVVGDAPCEVLGPALPENLLRIGTNVFAVEVHQATDEPFQNDVTFDANLTFYYPKVPLIPTLVIRRIPGPNEQVTIEASWNDNAWKLETAPDSNGPWSVQPAPNSFFRGPASEHQKFFRLTNP